MKIQNNNDLLDYLLEQAASKDRRWFSFEQQKILGIQIAYDIARNHADKMSPEQVVDYVIRLNGAIYHKLIVGNNRT
jgi:hypothetical protein